jgi:hypothetical protein
VFQQAVGEFRFRGLPSTVALSELEVLRCQSRCQDRWLWHFARVWSIAGSSSELRRFACKSLCWVTMVVLVSAWEVVCGATCRWGRSEQHLEQFATGRGRLAALIVVELAQIVAHSVVCIVGSIIVGELVVCLVGSRKFDHSQLWWEMYLCDSGCTLSSELHYRFGQRESSACVSDSERGGWAKRSCWHSVGWGRSVEHLRANSTNFAE